MTGVIRVLIIDDSAFIRKAVGEMLSHSPFIEVVGQARDGCEALDMIGKLKPDVITCDLMMPRLDGVGFVREQMARAPVPILILTAAPEDGDKALEAMEAGAVDIVQKPTALANDQILQLRGELIEKVKAVAHAHAGKLQPMVAPPPVLERLVRREVRTKIVVIGISTGGPQALRYLLPQFPADFPVPIAMVLHMPLGYTEMFAQKLNEISRLKVTQAREGDEILPGAAFLAPAGSHLLLRPGPRHRVTAQLSSTPLNTLHRPAIDQLFRSAAECYGDGVLGVVMTGMGNDGKEGSAWIKARGGTILTEAEQSCIIYGMPRSVVEAGLSDAAVPLDQMAQTIMKNL